SEKCVSLLVNNLGFLNPDVDFYTRGPLSYTEPEPKDLPVFAALLKLGLPAVDSVLQRALAEDELLVRSVLAELTVFHFQFNGALDWIDMIALQNTLNEEQRARLNAVRALVEAKR